MATMIFDRALLQKVASSRINYWAAFIVDIVAALVFAWLGVIWYSGSLLMGSLLVLAGFLSWGFLEYFLHRWILHGQIPMIKKEHARHHGLPQATISTPAMVIPFFATLTCALLAWISSPGVGALLTFGVYIGYNYFAIVHHLQHHRPEVLRSSRFFGDQLKLHEIHHHEPHVLFGISSSIWDRVFGTFRER